MANNSVSLHRVFTTTPEKIYRAFIEADAYAAWLPPNGFFASIQQWDAKVGGGFKMSFTNFTTGNAHSFSGEYVELQPNSFIKYIDRFDNPHMPGDMPTSIWITKNLVGTEVKILQENIPAMIPVEACYLGWQESLEKLKKLVEPNIPDN